MQNQRNYQTICIMRTQTQNTTADCNQKTIITHTQRSQQQHHRCSAWINK